MPARIRPIEVQQLKGADKKDPQRYRKEIPKHKSALGRAPAHLSPEAKKMWNELVGQQLPGVPTTAERAILEILANMFADYRKDPSAFSASKIGQMISCLGRLGMTPTDRMRLGTEKLKDNDAEFNEF